jgi:hypothetical protein
MNRRLNDANEMVANLLRKLKVNDRFPECILCDDTLEFRSEAFQHWAQLNGVRLEFRPPRATAIKTLPKVIFSNPKRHQG